MIQMKPNHESREKKNQVAFEKKVNTDGSYVEIITDPQNNRVEICEYDASGDNVVRVYRTFEKVTPISDDEIDTYIDKINSKYK